MALKENANTEDETYLYEGHTFRIRETRHSDIPKWYKWFNDPDITRYLLHGVTPNTLENQDAFRNEHINDSQKIIFSIIAKNSSAHIGTCSINLHGPASFKHGEISLIIGDKNYQKGSLYLEITSWH